MYNTANLLNSSMDVNLYYIIIIIIIIINNFYNHLLNMLIKDEFKLEMFVAVCCSYGK